MTKTRQQRTISRQFHDKDGKRENWFPDRKVDPLTRSMMDIYNILSH